MTTLEESLLTDLGFTDTLDWRVSATGDVEVITGVTNLKAALLRRLLTVPGSVISLVDYGVGLKLYQNAPLTLSVQRNLATLIKEQFEKDARVTQVTSVRMTQHEVNFARIEIDVRVEVAGAEPVDIRFEPIGD